jgi:hypothetical protein
MPRSLFIGKLLTAQSALDAAGYINEVTGSKAEGTLIVVTFGAGTSAGVVTIEGAASENFTGTWAALATITWAAASRAHETFISGAFLARRVRISTAIVGGTVDVDYLITG